MPIHRYQGRYPRPTKDLFKMGLLKQMPVQKTVLLLKDSGINITYRLKGATPEKFRHASNILLEAAVAEAIRYPDYKWRFARFEVRLKRTTKGRKTLPMDQTYSAGKHTNSVIMVYGPGYETGDDIFLINKVEQIIDIPSRYIGKVNKQKPYTVLSMQVCLRTGEEPSDA